MRREREGRAGWPGNRDGPSDPGEEMGPDIRRRTIALDGRGSACVRWVEPHGCGRCSMKPLRNPTMRGMLEAGCSFVKTITHGPEIS